VVGLLSLALAAPAARGPERLLEVFAGSASKPALEKASLEFERKTGTRVIVHFGGSGTVLSQMKLARRGDVFVPGSADFMELAKRDGLVRQETEVRLAYLLPAVNVPRGNPENIRTLEDLARPGLRVGIARPDTVCVGLYAIEALEAQGLAERVRPNLVGYAESCTKTAQMLALGLVDAVLGWDVFEHWNPETIETVPLTAAQIPRIGYIPAAVSIFTDEPGAAQAFVDFLASAEGRRIFETAGYTTDLDEAVRRAGSEVSVGGEYILPERWR
jgi:molybdate transport system substrate-binding protein